VSNTGCYGRDGQVAWKWSYERENMIKLVQMDFTDNFHAAELSRWAVFK